MYTYICRINIYSHHSCKSLGSNCTEKQVDRFMFYAHCTVLWKRQITWKKKRATVPCKGVKNNEKTHTDEVIAITLYDIEFVVHVEIMFNDRTHDVIDHVYSSNIFEEHRIKHRGNYLILCGQITTSVLEKRTTASNKQSALLL